MAVKKKLLTFFIFMNILTQFYQIYLSCKFFYKNVNKKCNKSLYLLYRRYIFDL